jgi:cobalamin biosynthesis protein CobD/CbiB
MENRRGSMPVRELLDLRLNGVVVEDATYLMERLLGKLPLDGLNPSTLIFTHGFNVKASQQIVRRLVSMTVSFIGVAICLPFTITASFLPWEILEVFRQVTPIRTALLVVNLLVFFYLLKMIVERGKQERGGRRLLKRKG